MAGVQQRRPTLRDVAELAQVSFKTVSRVVNEEGGVSDELVSRVESAITELGYRPDDRARRLRQAGTQTGTIGFVLVDVANPFFSSILRGIEEVAVANGSLVLSGSTDGSDEREDQLIETFVARRVDGLIVVTHQLHDGPLQEEIRRGTPVVFLDLEPTNLSADLVRSDHRGGAVLATRHLIGHGHRRIMFLGDDPTIFSARLRLEGYKAAMKQAKLPVGPQVVIHGRHTVEEWRAIVSERLRAPDAPTAIFSAQNFITVGAVQAIHDCGLQRSVAQVGFDDIDLADVVDPGITVVPQQPRELGRRAAERLFDRIGGASGPLVRQVLPPSLIERGSGEIRA
jgi:LacI family transcriptional regulator